MTEVPERYAVLGDPIAHSRSPAMQNAALEALGRPERYGRRRSAPEDLAATLDELHEAGYRGVNLTVPLKRHVLEFIDDADEVVEAVGAVNTLVFDGARRRATNTDAPGFLAGLRELEGPEPTDITLLGRGGAGQAIAWALRQAFPGAHLDWVSRSKVDEEKPGIRFLTWDELAAAGGPRGELLINATTVGMAGGPTQFPHPVEFPRMRSGARVVDVVYPRPKGGFLDRAEEAGLVVQDGLPMLLWQGVRALETWLGAPLEAEIVEIMRAALRG